MKMGEVLPYLATFGLLLLWAITHLFNREDQPLPPRAGRPPNGLPPRPQPPAGQPRRVEPPMRWSPPNSASPGNRPPGGRPMRVDDDIVIIEPEPPKRVPSPARPAGAPGARRSPRGRTSAAPAAKPPESATSKSLSAPLSSTLAPLVNRPVEFKPLAFSQESLASQEAARKAAPAAQAKASPAPSLTSALDFPALVRSPDRVLQSVILGEILQPPLALRGRRR